MVIQQAVPSPPPPQAATMSKDVLYIGSAIPLETSSGLEALQQPLRSRYPSNDNDIEGIPSVLTILPSGIELKYADDPSHVVFFPFSALNMCAAVRCVTTTSTHNNQVVNRFVSLTESVQSDRPAIFATMTRRTKGRHVLECSGFLTKNPQDALDLVQWTSDCDKRSKVMSNGYLAMGESAYSVAGNSAYDMKQDVSFQTERSSPQETPVGIVTGDPLSQSVKVGSYNELPKDGYFYTTDKALVRKFSLHKFVRTPGPPPSQAPPPLPEPAAAPAPAPEPVPIPINLSQTVEDHSRKAHIVNGDQLDRRSTYSMPVTQSPRLIAVRGPPPAHNMPIMMAPRPMMMAQAPRHMMHPMHPMLVRPPMVLARPTMIPAAPMMSRAMRPMPMMMPVPMSYPGGPVPVPMAQPKVRTRRSSSSSSSSSSSHSRGRERRLQVVRRDHSFDSSSRPKTPPRDYSPSRRTSRKEDYQFRQVNGYHHPGVMTMLPRTRGGLPPGYVMLPQFANGAVYGAPTMPRSKSVPPHLVDQTLKKDKKKSKKDKKKSKKSSKKEKNGYQQHSPYALTDSHESDNLGYLSDHSPGIPNGDYAKVNKPLDESHLLRKNMFGMSRMSKNLGSSQYAHERSFSRNAAERAFSSSLANETRNSVRNGPFNAYAMNQNGGPDGEFPLLL